MRMLLRRTGRCLLPAILALLAAACTAPGSRGDYWNIRPIHQVRNSPVPVPTPALKPARTVVASARPTPVQAQQATPRTAGVTVRRGDTIYGIARRYSAPLEEMIALNRLDPPYLLAVGQSLSLPGQRSYQVQRGDTVYSIAKRHDVEPNTLASANNIRPPYFLEVGQKLALPTSRRTELAVAARPSPGLPIPRPESRLGFDWPVAGVIVSRFGPKEGGLRNDGINIRAQRGAEVRAADHGVVAYAGNGLKGFGNLILIRHADDWVTAYAHHESLLVKRGDTVRRGDVIGRVGSTGGVTEPQLHFEIRRGTKALDPLGLLPHLSASAH